MASERQYFPENHYFLGHYSFLQGGPAKDPILYLATLKRYNPTACVVKKQHLLNFELQHAAHVWENRKRRIKQVSLFGFAYIAIGFNDDCNKQKVF